MGGATPMSPPESEEAGEKHTKHHLFHSRCVIKAHYHTEVPQHTKIEKHLSLSLSPVLDSPISSRNLLWLWQETPSL